MGGNIFFDIKDLKYCGKNVIIGKTVRIRNPQRVMIGDGTIIDDFTYISSELEIGRNCHIATGVSISGGEGKLVMGNYSTLAANVSVHCASSDYRKLSLDLPSVEEQYRFGGEVNDVGIGDFVVVGAHSCILPGAYLPDGSAFGAYTLIKNIKLNPFHLYVGMQCKDLGERDLSEINKYENLNNKLKEKLSK